MGQSRIMGKGMLKREGDQLSISRERMKRMHNISPAVFYERDGE